MEELTYEDVDLLLTQFSESIQMKIRKLQYELSLKVKGYPGASRYVPNTKEENEEKYKKIFIKLEKICESELNSLKSKINN